MGNENEGFNNALSMPQPDYTGAQTQQIGKPPSFPDPVYHGSEPPPSFPEAQQHPTSYPAQPSPHPQMSFNPQQPDNSDASHLVQQKQSNYCCNWCCFPCACLAGCFTAVVCCPCCTFCC